MTTRQKPASKFVLDLLSDAFPPKLINPRRIGPEEEYIVTRKTDGTMGNTTVIFQDMLRDGWIAKNDPVTSALIGVRKGEVEISTDVGVGTLEIGFTPVTNLFDHLPEREAILKIVDGYLESKGLLRLDDYAAQPVTVPVFKHWADKGRSHFFRTYFPRDVDVQTASASSQVHIEVSQEEMITVLEVFLALSGVLVALNANSPIWGGKLDPMEMMASRLHFWDRFTPQKGCWSNVHVGLLNNSRVYEEQAPSSIAELAEYICGCKFLVHVNKGEIEQPDKPFEHWYDKRVQTTNDDELREGYLNHEGTLWWDARPRVRYGTIEVRPSCQNAHAVSSDALVLGLVENLQKTIRFVRERMSHEDWRRLRFKCLKGGLRTHDAAQVAREVLILANEGLVRRGFGEEHILKPLYQRLHELASPGLVKLHIFNEGGMPALLRHLLC